MLYVSLQSYLLIGFYSTSVQASDTCYCTIQMTMCRENILLAQAHIHRLFPSLESEIQGCIFHANCTHFLFFLNNEVTVLHFHNGTFTIDSTSELSNSLNSLYYTADLLLPCCPFTYSPDLSSWFCDLITVKPLLDMTFGWWSHKRHVLHLFAGVLFLF